MPVRIGIIGDFNPKFASHQATNDALQHAGAHLGVAVESEWTPTPSLAEPGSETALERFNGILASPGSPYKSFNGMLRGIEFARHRNWPFVGT
jgi:CTP synthase (UTP-ammonia lyase)